MKTAVRFLSYLLFFVLCSLLAPYFFKQHPFLSMSCLMVLAILVMRRDFMEAL